MEPFVKWVVKSIKILNGRFALCKRGKGGDLHTVYCDNEIAFDRHRICGSKQFCLAFRTRHLTAQFEICEITVGDIPNINQPKWSAGNTLAASGFRVRLDAGRNELSGLRAADCHATHGGIPIRVPAPFTLH
jgi:hypothetical protein